MSKWDKAFQLTMSALLHIKGRKKPEKVFFDDVVGCDEAKEEIKQIVDFLVDPSKYDSLGASRPKGILLVGPPGTGKTLMAKACAGEAGVPFLYACGSDFNGIYVGMGVAAVKRLFAKARKHRKSIIYIDELDYIGRTRNSGGRDASGATQDREATLNQLLSEMDGFEGKDGIVVMASTNRKEILDDALLRSGRFDMQVDIDRPDRRGRQQLFNKYISPLKLSDGAPTEVQHCSRKVKSGGFPGFRRRGRGGLEGADRTRFDAAAQQKEPEEGSRARGIRDDLAKELADLTPYMTGADVANVCATAGRIAARVGSSSVSREHFSAAVDRVRHGLEKPGKEVPQEEKERTAVHEAGHAVAGWMLPWCEPVVKVSIIWRGNALGFSQTAMTERLSHVRGMILDNVCMSLAGRAAEEVVFGSVSGGASSDLRAASRELYKAITEEGFGSNTGLMSPGERWLSERTMAQIDQEVQTILAEQYQRALELVREHRDKIDALSGALLQQEVVHKSDLEGMLGEKVTVLSATAGAATDAAAEETPRSHDTNVVQKAGGTAGINSIDAQPAEA